MISGDISFMFLFFLENVRARIDGIVRTLPGAFTCIAAPAPQPDFRKSMTNGLLVVPEIDYV